MITSKHILTISIVIPILIQLTACGTVTPVPMAIATTVPSLAPSAISTNTEPPLTSSSTATLTSVLSVPDGLRMVYHTSQGLYLKDGSNPPRQLTQQIEDYDLRISDDGEKIVFERRVAPVTLFSINADGSHELALVTHNKLATLKLGYDAFIAEPDTTTFVPGTHLLLFETADSQAPNSDLLLVDTDTGGIKSLLLVGNAADYYLSPDGIKIAVNTISEPGHIDIFSIDGKMLQRNIAIYTPSEPIYIPPDIHWSQDSNNLIIVLPFPTFYDTSGGAPNYTLWRYGLDENKSIRVPLDPMPKGLVEVSLDGDWVTYHDEGGALYVGNLRAGRSQLYQPKSLLPLYSWSPDNVHFAYGRRKIYLGALNTHPVFLSEGDFIGWLDVSHFIYYDYVDKTLVMGGTDGGISVILTDLTGSLGNTIFTFILLN